MYFKILKICSLLQYIYSTMEYPTCSTNSPHSPQRNEFNTDHLRVYYGRLFPYQEIFEWLSYGETSSSYSSSGLFSRREFSFTLEGEIYSRYHSFQNVEDMKKKIMEKQPHKIDIGAVYNIPPSIRKNALKVLKEKEKEKEKEKFDPKKEEEFKPEEKEFVIDIDLNDYDDVRLGCAPGSLWINGSWLYMSTAIKILDRALREDFGFKHILFVFSGRRGVHCWVCDKKARKLPARERRSLIDTLSLLFSKGKPFERAKPLHPLIKPSFPFIEETFMKMVLPEQDGQGILSSKERYEKVLILIPDEEARNELRKKWEKMPIKKTEDKSLSRWKDLLNTVSHFEKLQREQKNKKLADELSICKYSIMVEFVYPRFDMNVSMQPHHLLKSPFAVHPKTGKICVPILDIQNCHLFNPDTVPSLASLVQELDKLPPKENSSKRRKITYRTSLEPYVEGFRNQFLAPLLKENKIM
jgi:DNA primase small subunit